MRYLARADRLALRRRPRPAATLHLMKTVQKPSVRRPYQGWFVLAVGFLVMASGFALRNSFSVFYPAVVESYGWTRGNTAIMFSLSILVYGLLSPFVGGIVDRHKPQLVVGLGIGLLGLSFAACGFASQQWHFYLLFGVVVAMGIAMIGITPMAAVITPWFARHRAMVFAVLASGFGVSLVSAALVQHLITTYGWQLALIYCGVTVAVVMMPLVFVFFRRAPALSEQKRDPSASEERSAVSVASSGTEAPLWHSVQWTLGKAVRTPQFWLLWLAGFFQLGMAEKLSIAHMVYFFQDAGYTPMAAASVYSVFGIVFVAGCLASSASDRLGRERVYIPAALLALIGSLTLFIIDDAGGRWMAYVFAVVFGFGMGMMPPVLFAAVADLFHGRSYGAIQGMVALGFSAGGAVSPWLAGYLHDVTGTYESTLVILSCSIVACGIFVWVAAPRRHCPVQSGR